MRRSKMLTAPPLAGDRRTMQTRFVPTWLGLVTLGSLVTGCPSDDAAGDE